jgi:thioredoxin-like negative regulator of GroEL
MFKEEIENGDLTGVLFSSDSCSICTSLYQQLESRIPEQFPRLKLYKVKIEDYPDLRVKYMVFSVPTFVIFFQNQELIRKAGVFGLQEVLEPLERYYGMMFEE